MTSTERETLSHIFNFKRLSVSNNISKLMIFFNYIYNKQICNTCIVV